MAAPCAGRLRWPVQAPCSWGMCHLHARDRRLSGPLRVAAHTSVHVRAHACVRRESARSLRPRGRAFCPHLSVRIHVEFAVSASWIVHGVEVGAFLGSGEAFTARKFSVQIPAVPSAVREAAELPALRDDRRRHACAQGWGGGRFSEPKVLWEEVLSSCGRPLLPACERGRFRDGIAWQPPRFLAKPVPSSGAARLGIGATWPVWAFSTLPRDDLG